MLDMAFQYRYDKKEWIPCTDHAYIEKNIEDIPHTIFVNYINEAIDQENRKNTMYVFCPHHSNLEEIQTISGNHVISKDGCHFDGLIGIATFHFRDYGWYDSTYVPFRWRIFQRNPSSPINIACDVIKGNYCRNGILKRWENFAFSIDIIRHKFMVTPIVEVRYNKEDWTKTDVEIPDIVVNTALDAMRESTFLASGIKPSILSQMKGKNKIKAYVERPFDVNIVYLKTFFQEIVQTFSDNGFDEIFPYDAKDNYKIICNILEIKPPKSLRKAYAFNPYAIVWYMIFKQWNIEDVNLMQRFFYLDDCIANLYLSKFYFDPEAKIVTRHSNDALNRWKAVEFYCQWIMVNKGKKKLMTWLFQVSSQNSLTEIQWDILMAFHQYYDAISDEIKKRLLRDGLTNYIHDTISMEICFLSKSWQHNRVHYNEKILAYECRINDYEFRLVHSTEMLPELGAAFKNCVATYRKRVEEHTSIIVYVLSQMKYVACIEITNQSHIIQALGKYNHRLRGEVNRVCSFWAKYHGLSIDVDHLSPLTESGIEEFKSAVVERLPYIKSIEEMNLNELVNLKEDKIISGYYIQLQHILTKSREFSLSAPKWMKFNDEKSLLNYILPEGKRIYDAAFNGNTEAMRALGFIYFQGKVVQRNLIKAFQWFLKACNAGEKEAKSELDALKCVLKQQSTERDAVIAQAVYLLRLRKRMGEFG